MPLIEHLAGVKPTMSEQKPELDFVCNEYVLLEKKSAWNKWRGLGLRDLFGIAIIFVSLLIFVWLAMVAESLNRPRLFLEGPVFVDLVIPLVLLGISTICIVLLVLTRRDFPTNVRMAERGFWLAWLLKKADRTAEIPWSSICRVGAKRTKEFKANDPTAGIVVSFEIEKSHLPWYLLLSVMCDTTPLWTRSLTNPLLHKTFSIEFPLDSLTLDADRYRFMSAVRSRVAPAAVSDDFVRMCDSGSVPTFTQLWLDDMQSFRRTRADELAAGAFLQNGRFEIRSKIATGGQAKIYSAFDNHLQCMVAVKELVLPINAGADVRNRSFANVKNEALLLSKLTHPGIVKLLDNFVEDHRAYLVLEHIEGTSLRTLVKERGPLPPEAVSDIARQVFDFLDYIHTLSPPVIHRDLTPDNLMVTQDGTVRLLDFNVAQQLESASTKTVVGKHNYMAPEQFKGKPTTQSDLYSLGCTLYYLLTGQDPTPLSCSHPAKQTESVPPYLDNVVAMLTNLDVTKRYSTAKEAASDLAAQSGSLSDSDAQNEFVDDGQKLDIGSRIKVAQEKASEI